MRTAAFRKSFWKLYSFLNKCMNQQKPLNRYFTQEKLLNYKPGTPEFKSLKAAIKNISANLTQIPICIGDGFFGSGDIKYQCMPHNTRCKISQLSTGNAGILNQFRLVSQEIHGEWNAMPMKERIDICNKCADILATEGRHELNASIMLGQSKTFRQAEEDTCRTINGLRSFAELLSKHESDCATSSDRSGYNMRASGGCIAALTPYNWTSQAVNLALCPALMGNCVVWVPSLQSALSSYHVFRAFEKAGLPSGVISFIPMNLALFFNKASNMPHLSGINYAGKIREYQELSQAASQIMERPHCFTRSARPVENKNFHFVHESANVEHVAAETVRAAFDYNGQRGNSCENLFVPKSLWCDLQDAILSEIDELIVGDVCDAETTNSAVIDRVAYNRIVKLLEHADHSENCSILCGGNYNPTHGNFIEPTVVICKTPHEKLMTKEIEGPILSVCVYDNNEIDDIIKHIGSTESYTLAGSIFAGNDNEASNLTCPLSSAAANLYINKACIGDMDGKTDERPDFNDNLIAGQESLLKHW